MSDISVGTLGGATAPDEFTSAAMENLDKDTFLQLLVAQMKYQNPMDPMDSNEFVAQAAQYASVEQLENMAQSQAELRSMQMVTIATGLVGQEVTAVNGFTGEEITGVVDTVKFGTEPILMVEGAEVPLSAVISVTSAPATDTTNGPQPLPSAQVTDPPEAADEAPSSTTAPGPATNPNPADPPLAGDSQASAESPANPSLATQVTRAAEAAEAGTPGQPQASADVPPEGTTAVPNPFSTLIGTPR